MPVPDFCNDASPRLHHAALKTTFCGLTHPLSLSDAKVHQYRGIKYASVPARFRQSHLFNSYAPITDASTYGPICPQIRNSQSIEETLFGIPPDLIPVQDLKQDEFECLNLNITVPAGLNPRSRVPVMLWIHGGGDKGSGSQWFYDGGAIVRKSITFGKPVILVTFNFRLGLLGFATNTLIRDDNKAAGEDGTGNYGLRDQRKAMLWLHQYIGDFGGDPNKITIFGAGSGGADIVYHLLSRANIERPLFHNAIVQSAVFEPVLPDVSSSGWHLSRVMSALQVTTIEKFRQVPVEKLLGLGQNLRAVDDGVFFRDGWQSYFSPPSSQRHIHHHTESSRPIGSTIHIQHPPTSHLLVPPARRHMSKSRSRSRSVLRNVTPLPRVVHFKADLRHQPLIIGDGSADSLLWSIPISFWTAPGVVRRLKAICQSMNKASGILRAYDISSSTPDDEIMERVLELVDDARVAWPTQCVADNALNDRNGRNVWRFVFDQEGPSRAMPHHGADLMYLFDTVPLPENVFAATMDMDSFYDGPYDVSDDELSPFVHHEIEGTCNAAPECSEAFSFSNAFLEKCEKINPRGRLSPESDEWLTAVVDEYSYARVRDAMQERWISFAYGEAPWRDDKIFVFGPEGETGERSKEIFKGRRRKHIWKEALEPLGHQLVLKFGIELSRGPASGADRR